MKKKIEIMSRKAMTALIESGFPNHTAVISFYDPPGKRGLARFKDYKPIDYSGICKCVFSVGIHDIDIDILDEYDLTYETYFPEAPQLAAFIYKAVNDGVDIICQCEHGQSRSAACAAAILEHFCKNGISIFANYKYYPNQLIFNKTLDALRKYKSANEHKIKETK